MRGVTARTLAAALGVGIAAPAWAQQQPSQGPIYTCVNAAGKKLVSQAPIPECNDRPQRVLNADGSLRQVLGPTLTAEEKAEVDKSTRDAEAEKARRAELVRADRNLLARYPNEAAHRKAREKQLDDVTSSLKASEERMAKLAKERKPLMDEAEFYVGKQLPANLKTQIDANDAAVDAQNVLMQNQRLEVVRVTANLDAELDRLRKLWGGAQPGSLGPIPVVAPASAPVVAKKK